ncbi:MULTISPECIES: E2/UBC family protein [Shewanella]|uniref:E2/UBC family protein n=1 Tax=Shewanella TaxID=22 RepID=UPI000F4239E8|nr:E2/UBC family protein [Shewanella algae]AYV11521.1 hypothetical protein EEY24_00705 [Shewanella algae]
MSELHQILLGLGYRFLPAKHIPQTSVLHRQCPGGVYAKDILTEAGTFKVGLHLKEDPHVELPKPYLIGFPEGFSNQLVPHINHEGYLCYVEQMEADWDPNHLGPLYTAIDEQICTTLCNSMSRRDGAESDAEIEPEFASYWDGQYKAFLLSRPTKDKQLWYAVTGKESVVYSDDQATEFASWMERRNLADEPVQKYPAHYLRVRPSKLAGVAWPPCNLGQVLDWLGNVDNPTRSKLIDCLIEEPGSTHLFVMDVAGQEMIGVFVQLNKSAVALAAHNRKRRRRPARSYKQLIIALSGKQACERFHRIEIENAEAKWILSRNNPNPEQGNLSDKKIALIGCGTIGGYAADLLMRSGAGCGRGFLHVFDPDTMKPQNAGRHILGTQAFGQNKAEAMATKLRHDCHLVTNIEGKGEVFPITIQALRAFDFVIDVTGRPPISKRLAAVIRMLPQNDRPMLIHGWNDGNGRMSKVLIDDGSGCYGCLISDPAFYTNEQDRRLEGIDRRKETRTSCGNTYTPYHAGVSIITAGIMQQAVMYALGSELPWNYTEHVSAGGRTRKPKKIQPSSHCSICNAPI